MAEPSLEQVYQKKTPIEHVLIRPDTYIGSIDLCTTDMWVYDAENGITQRPITYAPGLLKIFDEILVNASDHRERDPTCDTIKVEVDQEKGTISVFNNGTGVPVEIHKEEKVYIPELIFGELLTGSNFDDTERKVTGGRNGYGAKLANIFSTEFIVETVDSKRGRKFKQVFNKNMTKKGEPKVSSSDEKGYCKITFKPELSRFNMATLDDDIVALFHKRVFDVAGCKPGLKVSFNGVRVPVKNFQDYMKMYIKDDSAPRLFEKAGARWEVGITISDGQPQNVSFVNGIATTRGGKHVEHALAPIVNELMELVNKKSKGSNIKPFQIKNHIWIFVNALIENPAFDTQTKENLTSNASTFGSKVDYSPEFLKKIAKCGIVENILAWLERKQMVDLGKKSGSKQQSVSGIPKLDDANDAGGRKSEDCTLILTEGDSAKALAVSGLGVVGRDQFGVFPLRGKLLNVRDATHKQLSENAEIQAIVKIMGLQFGKEYESVKSLRYGHLMIMADQDHDGSHIKGLVINFIHKHWPSLLKVPGFMQEFITPIVKVTKGSVTHQFFSLPELKNWLETHNNGAGWHVKYYKGLGTSTRQEAQEYFSDLALHRKTFAYEDAADDDLIDMAFSKKKADDRKEWLRGFDAESCLDNAEPEVTYKDFIHKELIHFSHADIERSIPNLYDGLKPGQRKILYCAFKRNLKTEIKVVQLAGYVSEHSAYHHGEVSLQGAIVNMAQNFVGSNNINLLRPNGQFGTRLQGGKDAASARYIFTCLNPITRYLFPESDDKLLKYLEEDGQSIQPEFYLPILPTILVNGASGIGTGWSTDVPQFNPRDIAENIKKMIRGGAPESMKPWYENFKGEIEAGKKDGSFVCKGIWNRLSEDVLEVTELPVGKWTQEYKEMLEGMITGTASEKKESKEKKPSSKKTLADKEKEAKEEKKSVPIVKEFKEYHTDTTVHFVITFLPGKLSEIESEGGIEKVMKLSTKIATSNMHLFDHENRIQKFESPEQILSTFFEMRKEFYHKRKRFLVDRIGKDLLRMENRTRFIKEVISGALIVNNRKREELLKELSVRGYTREEELAFKHVDDYSESNEQETTKSSYDYLLSMPIWNLTLEKVQKLMEEQRLKKGELDDLLGTSPEQLWERDLDNFLEALEVHEAELRDQTSSKKAKKGSAGAKARAPAKRPVKKAVSVDSDDEEMDSEDDFDEKPKKAVAKKAVEPKPVAVSKPAPSVAKSVYEDVKPVASATTAAVPKPKKAPAKKAVSVDSDEEDVKPKAAPKPKKTKEEAPKTVFVAPKEEKEMSLMERLAARLGASSSVAPAKKVAAKKVVDSDASGSEADSPVKKAPAKKAAAKPKTLTLDDSDSDGDKFAFSGSDADDVKEKKVGAKRTKKASSAAPAKKQAVAVDSDEEEVAKPKAVKPKKAPAKKVVAEDKENIVEKIATKKLAPKATVTAAPAPKTSKAKTLKKKFGSDSDEEEMLSDMEVVSGPRGARARKVISYGGADSDDGEESDAVAISDMSDDE